MARSDKDKLVRAAQERGATLTETEEGWVGVYHYGGETWRLNAETLEALSDDMNAMIDILEQDDTYSLDYNEDADRYVIDVQGFDEPFSDAVLAKAFAQAKGALMERMRKEEAERVAREPKAVEMPQDIPWEAAQPVQKSNGEQKNKPQPLPPGKQDVEGITAALFRIGDALYAIASAISNSPPQAESKQEQEQEVLPPEEPAFTPPPTPKRKRGISKTT